MTRVHLPAPDRVRSHAHTDPVRSSQPLQRVIDQRPAAQQAMQIQALVDSSPQVTQLKALQRQVDASMEHAEADHVDEHEPETHAPVQMKAQGGVVQFGRSYGNSAKLARSRFNQKDPAARKRIDFKKWKRGREAQHLIPAQVGKAFGIPSDWLDGHHNGMMMPSGRRNSNHLRDPKLDKGKLHHIKGAGAHPVYNKTVHAYAVKRGWKAGKVSEKQFRALALFLRKKNRPRRKGPAKGYVDDVK